MRDVDRKSLGPRTARQGRPQAGLLIP